MARLERLRQQERDSLQAAERVRTEIANLNLQIAATPEVNPPPPRRPVEPVVEEHRCTLLEYEEALERYTPDHPSVERLRLRLDLLEAQLPAEPAYELPAGPVPNPLYQNLVSQLRAAETELTALERNRELIRADVDAVNALIAASPTIEQRAAELVRRTTVLQQEYDDLGSRLFEAELARSLDGQQGGSLFSVLDAANPRSFLPGPIRRSSPWPACS